MKGNAVHANSEKSTAPIRLIATDLDGTLLRDDRAISPRTRATLMRAVAAGVRLVLVTARPPRFVHTLAQTLDVAGLAICCNGAIVYDIRADELLEHTPLAAAEATAVALGMREVAPGVTFAIEAGRTFGAEPAYLALGALAHPQDDHIADALTLCAQPVTKLIARHPTEPAADLYPLAAPLARGRAEVTFSSPHFLEFSAFGVDKAATLARLCQRLGVAPAEVIAFGDMPNDAAMLRWAGYGAAVANAHPDALAAARLVTESNMEDGVALALERLLGL